MKWTGERYKCRNCGEIYPYSLSKCSCGGICDKIADAPNGSSKTLNSGRSRLADILKSEKQKEQDEFENELARLYNAVEEACSKNEYIIAISHLEKILEITPDSEDAKELLDFCKKRSEQTKAVIAQLVCNLLDFCKKRSEQTTPEQTSPTRIIEPAEDNAEEMFNRGWNYYIGNGVPKNYTEAVKWYRKAAMQRHALAQFNLGFCYYHGYGVKQNYAEAVKWYHKSAEQGYVKAQEWLGWCYKLGKGVLINRTEAIKWYRKAAEQGSSEAISFLKSVSFIEKNANGWWPF